MANLMLLQWPRKKIGKMIFFLTSTHFVLDDLSNYLITYREVEREAMEKSATEETTVKDTDKEKMG